MAASDWMLRPVRPDDRRRFVAEGWWTGESLGQRMAARLATHADRPFVIHSAIRPWRGTFGDVLELSRRVGTGLLRRGVRPGDLVSFQTPNWLEGAATFYGAAMVGAIVAPVVHIYGRRELSYVLAECRPRVHVTASAFGHQDFLANLADIEVGPEIVVADGVPPTGTSSFEELAGGPPLESLVPVDPASPALVGWTSGTTANPKGVVHSHETVLAEVAQLGATSPPTPLPSLVANPISHAIGMLNALLIPVDRGKAVHLLDLWDPGTVLDLMVEEDLTTGGGATFFLTSLLDHPGFTAEHLAHIPYQGMGGAPIPRPVAERASALGINVHRMYGSTEHPSVTGCTFADPLDKRLSSDGRLLPGNELRLVDADDKDVGPGVAGEILSRGPELFLGYTDRLLTERSFDPDGWYRTGDIGVLDDDGYLLVTDRIADVIIRGGENVSAAEVEEVLLGFPGLAEAAVVAAPDLRLGEHGVAVVRLLPGHPAPDLDALRRHLEDAGLARQKWPEELVAVEEFPRTPAGKIQKFVLRDQLRSR